MEACRYCGKAEHDPRCPVVAMAKADTEERRDREFRNLDNIDRIMAAADGPLLDELKKFLKANGLEERTITLSIEARRLRKRMHEEMRAAYDRRLKENPTPTDDELSLGLYVERIEPHVRDAVLLMRRKGYQTSGSGFDHFNAQSVSLAEPDFGDLTAEERAAFEASGVKFSKDGTSLSFNADEIEFDVLKQKWDHIAALLPDLGHPAPENGRLPVKEFRENAEKYRGKTYPDDPKRR